MTLNLRAAANWTPPPGAEAITVIDAHTEGEPLRVVVAGYPAIPGATVLERRRFAREKLDRYRTALMFEPRGHADMYGCLVLPPVTETAHFSVLFMHNEGYSTMCGHGILAVTKVALETGILPADGVFSGDEGSGLPQAEREVRIDSPAGLVTATATMEEGRVTRVRFRNVPSWVDGLDEEVEVPGLGSVRYDLAFGGAYYAYVDAEALGLGLSAGDARTLFDVGMRIKREVMRTRLITHPEDPDLGFLFGVIFTGPALGADAHSRNVCVFAEGEVDRSPTGTGVSGRAAILAARGELEPGQSIRIESILGTTFGVKILDRVRVGDRDAVIPEVEGRAFITGKASFWLDPKDPLRDGFMIR